MVPSGPRLRLRAGRRRAALGQNGIDDFRLLAGQAAEERDYPPDIVGFQLCAQLADAHHRDGLIQVP